MTVPKIAPGELTVTVVADATARSRLSVLRQRYPQRVTTALHPDPLYPGAAMLCVQSPSGGTFSDDDLRTTVRTEPGSHLMLTTQAATQVFAGSGVGSRHRLEFSVSTGSTLEYLPKTIIPQCDSRLSQHLELDLAAGGRYLGWDAVAAGRIAHGERHRYARVDTAFTVRCDGRVVARDRQLFVRGGNPLLDGDYVATLLVLAPGAPMAPVLAELRDAFSTLSDTRGACGVLPGETGVFSRITALSAPDLHRAQQVLHRAARRAVLTTPIARSA